MRGVNGCWRGELIGAFVGFVQRIFQPRSVPDIIPPVLAEPKEAAMPNDAPTDAQQAAKTAMAEAMVAIKPFTDAAMNLMSKFAANAVQLAGVMSEPLTGTIEQDYAGMKQKTATLFKTWADSFAELSGICHPASAPVTDPGPGASSDPIELSGPSNGPPATRTDTKSVEIPAGLVGPLAFWPAGGILKVTCADTSAANGPRVLTFEFAAGLAGTIPEVVFGLTDSTMTDNLIRILGVVQITIT